MTPRLYDHIIVGGGSAGSALANRLTADPANRVLVLEAGRPDWAWDIFIHMPSALAFPIGSRFYDWKYESEPEPFMGGRRVYHARGKVLGGSSSINGMIFQRGNPLDYERWAADPGMETWDWAHCLPYFKRMETCLAAAPDDPYRGHDGPLILERGPATNPLFGAFFEAVQQAGYALSEDVNGYRQEGFGPFDRNIHRSRRLSAARAYLHPVMGRKNLRVETGAFVTRILFQGNRAVGVEYTNGGPRVQARAGEVILAGGAIASPQLLQLSGVGDAAELQRLGIDVVADVPGVGEHLQDHLEVYIQHRSRQPVSVAPAKLWRNRPWVGFQWLFLRRGPGATNHFEGGGFARSNDDVAYPNLMFHFLPIAIRYDGSSPVKGHGYQVHVGPMYSDARGSVRIKSTDPAGAPRAPLQLPVDRPGPARMGRGGPRHAEHPRPARIRTVQRRRDLAGTERRDRRRDPGMGRPRRRDGAPSLVHGPDGHRRALRHRSGDDGGPRHERAPRRGRLRVPVHPERQHLCAGDDGGREGRGSDHRQRAARTRTAAVLSPPGAGMSSHASMTGIELRTFPSADPVFHAFACEALEALRKPTTDALQDRIRARYPTAVVRAQEDLARRGGEPTVWYAFRYGTVAHGPPGMPVIDWDGPDMAWAILDEGRHFVDLNAALAAIVELPRRADPRPRGRGVHEPGGPVDPRGPRGAVAPVRRDALGGVDHPLQPDGRPAPPVRVPHRRRRPRTRAPPASCCGDRSGLTRS